MRAIGVRGFSLVEALIASALVLVAIVGLMQLTIVSIGANQRARTRSVATLLAREKLEELVAAAEEVVPGADFIDARGQKIGAGTTPPPGTLYVRNWSADPLAANPAATVLEVTVALTSEANRPAIARLIGLKAPRRPRRKRRTFRADRRFRSAANAKGFTLVELLVALAVMLSITAAMFAAVRPAESIFAVESESADAQQRLRVAANALFADLVQAGAGNDNGADAGPLIDFIPPILPFRPARTGGDPAGTFRPDVITVLYVPSQRGQTTIAEPMPATSGQVRVNIGLGCPLTDVLCGLSNARTVLIYDANGSFDRFRVEAVSGSSLELVHTSADSSKIYAAGSRIVEAITRSYFLRPDESTGAFPLVRDDGDGYAVVPVADHVVQLRIDYFGDPRPPLKPPPPEPADQPTLYPPGENCVASRDATSAIVARLQVLDAGNALVELPAAIFTDGPWCPDAMAANRFDADLYRIRRVAVSLRVESANAALRGPAGALFSRGGTSRGGQHFLPDQSISFQVSPRNLGLVR